MSNRGLVVPVDRRRMISTAIGITLIAVGAILRFAVPATFTYGLNAHVVSVIVMLAGIFGLLLSLLVWGPLDRRRNHYGGFGRTVPPPGSGMPARTSRQRRARGSREISEAVRVLRDYEENGPGTLGLVTIALVVPACARDCDSGCSGPWRHLTFQAGQVMRYDKSYPPAETNATGSGRLDAP